MRALNGFLALWTTWLLSAAGLREAIAQEAVTQEAGAQEAGAESHIERPGPNCCWVICNICCWLAC